MLLLLSQILLYRLFLINSNISKKFHKEQIKCGDSTFIETWNSNKMSQELETVYETLHKTRPKFASITETPLVQKSKGGGEIIIPNSEKILRQKQANECLILNMMHHLKSAAINFTHMTLERPQLVVTTGHTELGLY